MNGPLDVLVELIQGVRVRAAGRAEFLAGVVGQGEFPRMAGCKTGDVPVHAPLSSLTWYWSITHSKALRLPRR